MDKAKINRLQTVGNVPGDEESLISHNGFRKLDQFKRLSSIITVAKVQSKIPQGEEKLEGSNNKPIIRILQLK